MTDSNQRPIAVGDLVRIVRNHGCLGPDRGMGVIFTVERMEIAHSFHCRGCQQIITEMRGKTLLYGRIAAGDGYYPLAWVKKIPPLEELEGANTDEPIKEPA